MTNSLSSYDPANPTTNMASGAFTPHLKHYFNCDRCSVPIAFLLLDDNTLAIEILAAYEGVVGSCPVVYGNIKFDGSGIKDVDPQLCCVIEIYDNCRICVTWNEEHIMRVINIIKEPESLGKQDHSLISVVSEASEADDDGDATVTALDLDNVGVASEFPPEGSQ